MGNCYASKIVKWALGEVGYKEGSNNYNKYAADIDKNYPDFYNGKKQNAAWCDVFVDDGMIRNYGEKDALRLTCQPKGSCGAGCKYSYGYYKAKKQVGKEPKIGAQIFFGSSESKINHTGLVVDIKGDKVYTVEGNSNNQVAKHTYSKTSSKIFGYGYPKYDAEPITSPNPKPEAEVKEDPKPETKAEAKTKTYTVNVKAGHILRLRKTPDKKSDKNIIAKMPKGAKFEVSKTSNGWAYGKYKTYTGWASLDYLK